MLTAPGLNESMMMRLSNGLQESLMRSLTWMYENWIGRIWIDYRMSQQSEVIIEILAPGFMGKLTQRAVLSAAQTFLIVRAEELRRRPFILTDGQRLVPLGFTIQFCPHQLRVLLPQKMELVTEPCGESVVMTHRRASSACQFLETTLVQLLGAGMPKAYQPVVTAAENGYVIEVLLGDRRLEWCDLEGIEASIIRALEEHARHPDEFSRLVFCRVVERGMLED
jgi:hypothetical protein